MARTSVLAAVALLCLGLAAAAQESAEVVARAIVPLLKDARASMQPRLTVEPGTLPPSPITGRNSTLAAVTIGKRQVPLRPEVDALIDRLLAWDVKEPLPAADRDVVIDWVEELRAALLGRLAARATGVGCDDACLIGHLTKPDAVFGDTRAEQVQGRNELLLDALDEVVPQ
jgi:hypothetical protein